MAKILIFGATSGMASYHPRLSDDGRYVAFKAGSTIMYNTSYAGAIVILRYDSTMGTTALVNANGIGCSVDLDDNDGPEMTPDGRFIAFDRHEGTPYTSYSSVHVWDSQSAVDTLVSDNGHGVQANTSSYAPVITPDGQFVAFLSNVTNLTGNTVSNGCHVYLRSLQSSTTQLVDVDTNGAENLQFVMRMELENARTTQAKSLVREVTFSQAIPWSTLRAMVLPKWSIKSLRKPPMAVASITSAR